MGYENLSNYTEVDPGTFYTVTAPKVAFTALTRNDTAYVYDDRGTGYFSDDFVHKFEVQFSNVTGNGFPIYWQLSNVVKDLKAMTTANDDYMVFNFYPTNFFIRIGESGGEITDSTSGAYVPVASTTYFITITYDKSGGAGGFGQLKAYIRTGSHSGTLRDTLSLDRTEAHVSWRYIYAGNTYDDNNGTSVDGFTQNLDLGASRRAGRHGFTSRSAWRHRR